MIYLVRHAPAGRRTGGTSDHLRPLSVGSRHQAEDLAGLLEAEVVGDISSRPFVRFVETTEPLAARIEREVVVADTLTEGGQSEPLLRLPNECQRGASLARTETR